MVKNVYSNKLLQLLFMKKQKRFQLKYIPFSHYECKDPEDYRSNQGYPQAKVVDNPTPYKNLPEGEYLIRGDKQFHCKLYHHFQNVWYLMEVSTKSSDLYSTIVHQYQLFPCLKTKEWEELGRHYAKLTKYWRRMVYGYFRWKELRDLSRDVALTFFK